MLALLQLSRGCQNSGARDTHSLIHQPQQPGIFSHHILKLGALKPSFPKCDCTFESPGEL